jgi:chromosome condensin MukBEF complex kleisin-like MukF subunit
MNLIGKLLFLAMVSNVRKITSLFKHTNVNIAFRSTNTIRQCTKPNSLDKTQDYNNSGIYKFTCKTCNKSSIGQTSRNLAQIYCKHVIRYIRNNDPQSAFAQHISWNLHEYGTITDTMTLLKPIQKTSLLIPYEQFFIQSFHHKDNLISEQGTGEYSN